MKEKLRLVLQQLRDEGSTPEEQAALAGLRYVAHADDRCILEVKPLLATFVRERLLPRIEQMLAEALGRPVHVFLRPVRSPQRELFPLLDHGDDTTLIDESTGPGAYTFENFIVGASNQFAHAAALAVARKPGQQYNPLFIYGGVGLGKTHLLRAIAQALATQHPGLQVRYMNADSFMVEVVHAIRKDQLPQFKANFARVDVLLVDDVQLLAGRERTQQELFHLFNQLYEAGKQIVLAGDQAPRDLVQLEERLRNRFEWGLVVDLQPPDLETRIAILQRKAQFEGVELPYPVALALAENSGQNVRELHGLLTRLLALASLSKEELTVSLAQKVAAMNLSAPKPLTPERIQEIVANFFGLRPADLRSARRTRAVATARQIAMYLCRTHLGASFPHIGECFGGRDHTTVMHAVEVIERRQSADPRLRGMIQSLRAALEGGSAPASLPWKTSSG
ncbi:MAG: chromosomal replication initiator protein DnaA [Candidatus Binatia bacterium]|nr:chromosomal replication initiator protein DnaA [Candidatus Binatia bacterium]